MNLLMTLAMKLLGLQKALDAVNGQTSKAYIGGIGMILTGAASVMDGAAQVTAHLLAAQAPAEYWGIFQGLIHGNAEAAMIGAGVALIAKGYADIGNRHATAELHNDLKDAVQDAHEEKPS